MQHDYKATKFTKNAILASTLTFALLAGISAISIGSAFSLGLASVMGIIIVQEIKEVL